MAARKPDLLEKRQSPSQEQLKGILKRVRATPLPACIGLFSAPFPTHWAAIALALVLGAASFCALGVAAASLIRNSEAAPAVVQFVLFPLLFLSGTYMPIHSDVLSPRSVSDLERGSTAPPARTPRCCWPVH